MTVSESYPLVPSDPTAGNVNLTAGSARDHGRTDVLFHVSATGPDSRAALAWGNDLDAARAEALGRVRSLGRKAA